MTPGAGCVSALKTTALAWCPTLYSDISAEVTAAPLFSQGLRSAWSLSPNPEILHSLFLCVYLCKKPYVCPVIKLGSLSVLLTAGSLTGVLREA